MGKQSRVQPDNAVPKHKILPCRIEQTPGGRTHTRSAKPSKASLAVGKP